MTPEHGGFPMFQSKLKFLFMGLFYSSAFALAGQNADCTQDPLDTRTSSQCYWIGLTQNSPAKDRLCITTDFVNRTYTITLRAGYPSERVVSSFEFDRVHQYQPGLNRDLYRVHEGDSALQALSIEFDGTIDSKTYQEQGKVRVGSNVFFYRSYL